MRLTLSRPGANLPYAVIHRPQTAVPENETVLLGGSYDVQRGDFSGGGQFKLSHPPAFQHGDWLRLYWDGSETPDYTGEVLGEPWREGAGEIETRGLDEKLKASRWIGKASGDFPTFFAAVLALTPLPAGITVSTLPSIPGTALEADVASELLGDTIQAITPALGGRLIGVNNAGQIVCVDPETGVGLRFPWGSAEMPAGSTDNYANCVRFSFEYPSGDKGWFEGRNEPEITRVGGEAWTVAQATAREMGRAETPYSAATGSVTRTWAIPGQTLAPTDTTQTGVLATLVQNAGAGKPTITYRPDKTLALQPFDYEALYGIGAASVPRLHLEGLREAAIARVATVSETPLQRSEAAEIVDTRGQITLVVTGTFDPAIPPHETLTTVWRNDAGSLLDFYGGMDAPRLPGWDAWVPSSDGAGFVLTFPADVAQGLTRMQYKGSYINSRETAGIRPEVIELRPGGRFLAELESGDAPNSTVRSFNLELPAAGDYAPAVEVTVGVGSAASAQIVVPYPLTSGAALGGLSPLTILRDQMTQVGGVRLEFDAALTLPYGSSIEVQTAPGSPAGTAAWVLPGGLSALLADVAYAAQYSLPLPLATEARARAAGLYAYNPAPAADPTADGWQRFAIRAPQGWDGTGPPPDVTGRTLLLMGVQNIMDLRIKTPQLGNLATYGAELLRYRAEPVREWTGHLRGLRDISASGQAAFEGLTGPDVLLDIQRLSVDLDGDSIDVLCGSPLPSSTASAIAGTIKDIQRTVRRAGGA